MARSLSSTIDTDNENRKSLKLFRSLYKTDNAKSKNLHELVLELKGKICKEDIEIVLDADLYSSEIKYVGENFLKGSLNRTANSYQVLNETVYESYLGGDVETTASSGLIHIKHNTKVNLDNSVELDIDNSKLGTIKIDGIEVSGTTSSLKPVNINFEKNITDISISGANDITLSGITVNTTSTTGIPLTISGNIHAESNINIYYDVITAGWLSESTNNSVITKNNVSNETINKVLYLDELSVPSMKKLNITNSGDLNVTTNSGTVSVKSNDVSGIIKIQDNWKISSNTETGELLFSYIGS